MNEKAIILQQAYESNKQRLVYTLLNSHHFFGYYPFTKLFGSEQI